MNANLARSGKHSASRVWEWTGTDFRNRSRTLLWTLRPDRLNIWMPREFFMNLSSWSPAAGRFSSYAWPARLQASPQNVPEAARKPHTVLIPNDMSLFLEGFFYARAQDKVVFSGTIFLPPEGVQLFRLKP